MITRHAEIPSLGPDDLAETDPNGVVEIRGYGINDIFWDHFSLISQLLYNPTRAVKQA